MQLSDKKNRDIDLFFLNTISFSKKRSLYRTMISKYIPFSNHLIPEGLPHSSYRRDFKCTFQNLFSPKVDRVFCGALMCYAFRASLVQDVISSSIEKADFSDPKLCYPHTICLLYSLSPKTKCMHLHTPFTYNNWHDGEDWQINGLDLAVTQGLGHVYFLAKQLGYITNESEDKYFEHYLSISENSYAKLISNSKLMIIDNAFKEKLLTFFIKKSIKKYERFKFKKIISKLLLRKNRLL
jgi:hypothetical protein